MESQNLVFIEDEEPLIEEITISDFLFQDVGESDELYAMRQIYTKFILAFDTEISIENALLLGRMKINKIKYKVKYALDLETYLSYIDDKISVL